MDDDMSVASASVDAEYDNKSWISNSSARSVSEGNSNATTSRTGKSSEATESRELSLPEIMEQLERAVEAADGVGRVEQRLHSNMDDSAMMDLMESHPAGNRMDVTDTLGLLEMIETFEKEIAGHKSQITRLQCENVKLAVQLEDSKVREKRSKTKHLREVNSLQVQLTTVEATLKNADAERSSWQVKEAEYQRNLGKLQAQIRTHQRIPPPTLPVTVKIQPMSEAGGSGDGNKDQGNEEGKKRQEYLEARVAELGTQLRAYEEKFAAVQQKCTGDSDEKTKEFEELKERLSSQNKLVNELREDLTGSKVKETELTKEKALLEFNIRELQQELTLAKAVSDNKPERDKTNPKRMEELTSLRSQVTMLKANLKSAELHGGNFQQKESDYKRQLGKLQNQVRTLQRILYNKDPSSLPTPAGGTNPLPEKGASEAGKERQKILEARIAELESQLKSYTTRGKLGLDSKQDRGDSDEKAELIGELRGRLISQMKLVTCLKERLIESKSRESDFQKEKELLEFRIRELHQELTLSKTMSKPENQILADLTETVQSLNSRYFYREKELDSLIRRLSVKSLTTSPYHLPPSHVSFPAISNGRAGTEPDLNSNHEASLAFLLGTDYSRVNPAGTQSRIPQSEYGIHSPTTAMQLLGESVDDFLLLKR